ncbi:MAG: sulfatase-like hydrolase/transferase [Planctomycetota bacterium]
MNWVRSGVLCAITLGLASTGTPTLGQAADQPNVIFILADDLGIADIGAYGQETIQTPSLDALAAGGMVFSNVYSGAPVCSPSRAVLASGMHNGRFNNGNGVQLPTGMPTVASTLRDAGYETGLFGKLHLGGGHRLWGFNEFYGLIDGVEAWDHFNPWLERGFAGADGRIDNIVREDINGAYTDDEIAFETMRFVRDHANGDAPFFAQLNFQIAHFDLEVPEIEPYAATLDVPLQEQIHASMVTRMDRRIGELLDTLHDPNGDGDTSDSVRDNTVIMFASDNGAAIEGGDLQRGTGPHDPETFDSNGIYRGHKRDLYNGGILSPFIVSWADQIAPGSTSDRFGDFSDVLPTLADLAGTDTPVGLDGQSFADVLTGESSEVPGTRRDQYFEFSGGFFTNGATGDFVGPSTASPPRHALIRDGFKAILFQDGSVELYDLVNDPSESNNLFAQNQNLAIDMILEALDQNTGPTTYDAWNGGAGFADEGSQWGRSEAPGFNAILNIGTGQVFAERSERWLAVEVGRDGPASLNVVGDLVQAENGVRVHAGGDVHLEQSILRTKRSVELRGGTLSGSGTVQGQVVNTGTVSPDQDIRARPIRTEPAVALTFDFRGVQDDAPLTQVEFIDDGLELVSGLDFGPGVYPRSIDGFTGTDGGNEFNVSGMNASDFLSAVAQGDYVGYTVRPVEGLTMTLEAISFDLWRNGNNAPTDFAIATNQIGNSVNAPLGLLNNVFSTGFGSEQTFRAVAPEGSVVTGDLQVFLYGWGARDSLANVHITDATLEASFSLDDGNSLNVTNTAGADETMPFGVLNLSGDYYQRPGGELILDLAGVVPGLDADQLVVNGDAFLSGTLRLRSEDVFAPSIGQRFALIEATGEPSFSIHGAFDAVQGVLQDGFAWAVIYGSATVWAEAALPGDANLDQRIEQGDLNAVLNNWGQVGRTWSTGDLNGDGRVDQADLNFVLNNWGDAAAPDLRGLDVPEPIAAVWFGGLAGLAMRRRAA